MGYDVEHRLEAFDGAARTARDVKDQCASECAGDTARQASERVHEAHRLGEARGLALDNGPRCFGREVTGRKTGTAGRDEQTGVTITHLAKRVGDGLDAIEHHSWSVDEESGATQFLFELGTASVLGLTVGHRVRHGQDSSVEGHRDGA